MMVFQMQADSSSAKNKDPAFSKMKEDFKRIDEIYKGLKVQLGEDCPDPVVHVLAGLGSNDRGPKVSAVQKALPELKEAIANSPHPGDTWGALGNPLTARRFVDDPKQFIKDIRSLKLEPGATEFLPHPKKD